MFHCIRSFIIPVSSSGVNLNLCSYAPMFDDDADDDDDDDEESSATVPSLLLEYRAMSMMPPWHYHGCLVPDI